MKEFCGWTGKFLRINLTSKTWQPDSIIRHAERFIGGRGLASRLYWDEMSADADAFDPDNTLYFMNGPLCGMHAPGASRWVVLGKSPMASPEQYGFGNLGGSFGAALKWAGLDGLAISGASLKPVYLVIGPDGTSTFENAGDLWGKDTEQVLGLLAQRHGPAAHVAAIGPAGEARVRFANIIASGGAVASKGFGAVLGAKNLKAIVVRASRRPLPEARPGEARKVRREITALWKGAASGRFWNGLMLDDVEKIKTEPCAGCPGICRRGIYKSAAGEVGHRKTCVSSVFYYNHEMERTGKMATATFHATQVANRLGVCMLELRFMLNWLPGAIQRGLIDPAGTGLAVEEMGTDAWIENLGALICSRRGVGDLLAEGSRRCTKAMGAEDLIDGMVTGTGFDADFYTPRLFLAHAPVYATEPIYPITQLHRISFPMLKWMIWYGTEGMMGFLDTDKLRTLARTFWGSEEAMAFDTPDKKAEAAIVNQNRCYAMENMVFCDWFWPIEFSANSATGVGDPGLEARLFSALTGVDMDLQGYLRSGERSVNLCRAIYLREGRRGRAGDVLEPFNHSVPLAGQDPPIGLFNPELFVPMSDGEIRSRLGSIVEPATFKRIMDDYYRGRGWDLATGFFTRECLERLDLTDMVPELEKKGFIK
jgi:aldehyde:ferredoxin oxidoreductase